MLTSVKVTSEFNYMPWLGKTPLLVHNKGGVKFSKTKVNILFTKNGQGKSTLLKAIAAKTLCLLTGQQTNNSKGYDCFSDEFWPKRNYFSRDREEFIKGLELRENDGGSFFYFSQDFIPGGYEGLTHAMMCGFSDEANAVHHVIDKKSSGQQTIGMFKRFMDIVNHPDNDKPLEIYVPKDDMYRTDRSKIIKSMFSKHTPNSRVIMLDEPDNSLDLVSQLQMWKTINQIDLTQTQVIVATHSIFPLLNPTKYNFITSDSTYLNYQIEATNCMLSQDMKT